MTTTTTKTTTRDWLTIAGLGCLLLGGLYAAPSCIVGETPVFECGYRWSGVMQAAFGEKGLTSEEIKENGSWITWSQCMVDDADLLMTQAEDAHCHLQTTEMSCDGTAGCVWSDFDVDGRITEVCLLDNPDYEDVFRYYVEALIGKCEQVAFNQSIEPYPCEGLSQAQCNSKSHCTFVSGSGTCTFDFDTCTSSAVKAVPARGNVCTEQAGQCMNPLEDDPTGGQQSLPPPSQVITTINSTTWEIDAAFWAWITESENQPLLLGQSARIVPSGSNWIFASVNTNTYVYAMGLRNNDIFWEINGQALNGKTLAQIEAAITAVAGASTFTLKVKRGTVIRTHTYIIN